MSETSTHIVQLTAENFKRLKAVTITPSGQIVEISGRNAQGKSSVLDSIAAALGGKDQVPSKPIRAGESKGRVIVKLDNGIVVRRTFTAGGGGTLVVENEDGSKPPGTPQAILNALVGQLTFDPLAFTRMSSEDQLDSLRKIVGLDFTESDKEREEIFTERTDVNREVKRLEAQVSGIPHSKDAPKEPVDTAALMAKLRTVQESNRKAESAVQIKLDDARRLANTVKQEKQIAQQVASNIADLEARLGKLRAEFKDHNDIAAAAQKCLDEMGEIAPPVLENTSAIEEEIAGAETVNQKVRQNQHRTAIEKQLATVRQMSEKMTTAIDDIDSKKQHALQEAKFPVLGLSFNETGVLFNGIPFEQASSAEQLRVSVSIGAASNPKLRVLLIRDGSRVDDDGMKLLASFAAEHDLQLWIERVASGSAVGVIIEDGMVEEKKEN